MQGSQEGERAKLLSQPANFGENISMKVLFSTCRRADKLSSGLGTASKLSSRTSGQVVEWKMHLICSLKQRSDRSHAKVI